MWEKVVNSKREPDSAIQFVRERKVYYELPVLLGDMRLDCTTPTVKKMFSQYFRGVNQL